MLLGGGLHLITSLALGGGPLTPKASFWGFGGGRARAPGPAPPRPGRHEVWFGFVRHAKEPVIYSKNLTRCEQNLCNERKSAACYLCDADADGDDGGKSAAGPLRCPIYALPSNNEATTAVLRRFSLPSWHQEGAATSLSSSEIQSLGDGAGSGGRAAVLLARNACDLLAAAAAMA